MPFRRSFRPRRTFRRKPRTLRRAPRMRLLRRVPKRPVRASMHLKETFLANGGTYYNSNQGQIAQVTLNMIDTTQLNAYQTLYQNYKINAVKFMFINCYENGEYNQAANNLSLSAPYGGINRIVWITNTRGPTAPATELDALNRQNRKIRVIDRKPVSFYVKNPQFIQDTGAGNNEVTYKTGVLDLVNSDDLIHYCGEWYMDNGQSGNSGNNPYKVYVTLYFTLYNPL